MTGKPVVGSLFMTSFLNFWFFQKFSGTHGQWDFNKCGPGSFFRGLMGEQGEVGVGFSDPRDSNCRYTVLVIVAKFRRQKATFPEKRKELRNNQTWLFSPLIYYFLSGSNSRWRAKWNFIRWTNQRNNEMNEWSRQKLSRIASKEGTNKPFQLNIF